METAQDFLPRKNMRVGLIIFGSISITLGAMCLLMVPTMFLGSLIQVQGKQPTPISMILPAAAFYLLVAILDIWLGVGSIQCKRWARSLLLLWSLFWLFSGVFGLVGFSLMSGQLDTAFEQSGTQMPAGFAAGFKVVMFLFMALFYVALPGSFAWFYSLRNTRLTCEDRHPFPSWTDHCPAPVLALALLAVLWALSLPCLLLYASTFPLFGFYVEGIPAILTIVVLMALLAWSGWGLYRLQMSAWYLNLILTVLFMASYMVSFSNGGLMEFYKHMNMPAETMKLLEASPLLKSNWIGWCGLLFVLPYLGLMVYVRKYFSLKPTAI